MSLTVRPSVRLSNFLYRTIILLPTRVRVILHLCILYQLCVASYCFPFFFALCTELVLPLLAEGFLFVAFLLFDFWSPSLFLVFATTAFSIAFETTSSSSLSAELFVSSLFSTTSLSFPAVSFFLNSFYFG